jgi:hypothetical protein
MRAAMERNTYPFPLAVNSSHHSHYHRFLLGADPSVLAPFPKPYCVGSLAAPLGRLAGDLNLPRWRKLFHASIPWVEGFGPGHYDVGNVPAHRPLPQEYGRPSRRYGAYDFVQVADPSVSALALVAGDRRVLDRFMALGDTFCSQVEASAGTRDPGPSGLRTTGRMIAGQFAEPNNRWLMPFLHVHARVLNFTSFAETPGRLACIDSAALARGARRARADWVATQAQALSELGYRVSLGTDGAPALRVDGVSGRLVASMQAPRIAVMRILERIATGGRFPSAERLGAELPAVVIAAMAEQLESMIARSHSFFRPPKIGLPSEGPWRSAVREHLGRYCPGSLATLDAAAARARAVPCESSLFPTPPLDTAHIHVPAAEMLEAGDQRSSDPELGASGMPAPRTPAAPPWLAREFEETLAEVHERIVRVGPDDPLVGLRRILATIDQLAEGADVEQLRQSELLLGVEFGLRERRDAGMEARDVAPRPARIPLATLEELFEGASHGRMVQEREIGGRSL